VIKVMKLTNFCIKAMEGDIGIGLLSCCGKYELSLWNTVRFTLNLINLLYIKNHNEACRLRNDLRLIVASKIESPEVRKSPPAQVNAHVF
jgi:hypothetical protein